MRSYYYKIKEIFNNKKKDVCVLTSKQLAYVKQVQRRRPIKVSKDKWYPIQDIQDAIVRRS